MRKPQNIPPLDLPLPEGTSNEAYLWYHYACISFYTISHQASLWRGPFTLVDKLRAVNYRIQLLGVPNKTLVVHHNQLKHCFGTPKLLPEYNSQH